MKNADDNLAADLPHRCQVCFLLLMIKLNVDTQLKEHLSFFG